MAPVLPPLIDITTTITRPPAVLDPHPTPRPRGHPPLDDDAVSVPVSLKMSTTTYDQLYTRAGRNRLSVPDQIRSDIQAADTRFREKRIPK